MPSSLKPTDDDLAKMISRYNAGESFRAIAESCGMAKNTARRYLLGAGLSPDRARSISRAKAGRPSGRRGVKVSEQTRVRMSEAHVGRVYKRFGPIPEERRAKLSAALKGKNRRYTDDERRHIERTRQVCKRFIRRILLASGSRKTGTCQQIVGYTKLELVAHLGDFPAGSHVDHKVPMVEFFRRGIFDPAVINALPNLQTLSADENRRKGARVPPDAEEIIEACFSFSARMRGQVLTMKNGRYQVGLTR